MSGHVGDPAEPRLLVATRSADKLGEIRHILGECGAGVLSLDEQGVERIAEEDAIERFDSFAANAVAKATHFCDRTGMPTVADDSGIVVPALGGRPGVLSKRYAESRGVTPSETERDATNLALLLDEMADLHGDDRRAYYACVAALAVPARHRPPDGRAIILRIFTGTCEGVIAPAPRGSGGFGYDPIFQLPDTGVTFGEAPASLKHRLSHRARAFRALASCLPAALVAP